MRKVNASPTTSVNLASFEELSRRRVDFLGLGPAEFESRQ